MAVLMEAISVVVRVRTLDEKFPGGLREYQRRCPNGTFCADGELARIGFMTPRDVQLFTGALQRLGFEFLDEHGEATDFAVVDQNTGPTTPCCWLEFDVLSDVSAAWLAGTPAPREVHCPEGWEPRKEPMTFVPNEEIQRMEYLRRRGPTDVYFDREKEQETYVGSPFRDGVVPFEDLPSAPLPADSH